MELEFFKLYLDISIKYCICHEHAQENINRLEWCLSRACYIHNKVTNSTKQNIVISITMSQLWSSQCEKKQTLCTCQFWSQIHTKYQKHIPFFCTSYIHNNATNISKKYQPDVMYISILIANSHQIPKNIPFFLY